MHLRMVAAVLALLCLVCYSSLTSPTTPFTTNASSLAACKGDIVRFPLISKEKCSSPKSGLKLPNGKTFFYPRGRIVKEGLQWFIHGIREEDEGLYINRLSCYERMKDLPTTLVVNCKRISAYSGTQKILHFPVPKVLNHTEDFKLDIVAYRSSNGKPALELFNDGMLTKQAKEYFRKRLAMDFKESALTVTEVSDKDAGNYTAIWFTMIGRNRVTRRFTVVLNVQNVPPTKVESSATTSIRPHEQNNSNSNKVGGLPTGKTHSGGVKIIVNILLLLVCISSITNSSKLN